MCKYSCLLLIPDKKANQIKPEAKLASPQKIFPPALIAPVFLTGIILMGVHPSFRLTVPEWVNAAVGRGKRCRACRGVGREAIVLPRCLLAAAHSAFQTLRAACSATRRRLSASVAPSCIFLMHYLAGTQRIHLGRYLKGGWGGEYPFSRGRALAVLCGRGIHLRQSGALRQPFYSPALTEDSPTCSL